MRWVVVGIACSLLLVGCERSTPTPGTGKTITVDRGRNGETVELHPGDVLRLDLGSPEGSAWQLTSYPTEILTLVETDRSVGGFTFRVVAAGDGSVEARRACTGTDCPGSGDNPIDLPAGETLFRVRVLVSG